MIRSLLSHGARANAWDEDGSTALRLASWCGDREAVRLLLVYGADPNAGDRMFGTTPLIATDSATVASLLVRHGANVNLADSDGETPLMSALEHGNFEVTELLLRAGAATDVRDAIGMSVRDHDRRQLLQAAIDRLARKDVVVRERPEKGVGAVDRDNRAESMQDSRFCPSY